MRRRDFLGWLAAIAVLRKLELPEPEDADELYAVDGNAWTDWADETHPNARWLLYLPDRGLLLDGDRVVEWRPVASDYLPTAAEMPSLFRAPSPGTGLRLTGRRRAT